MVDVSVLKFILVVVYKNRRDCKNDEVILIPSFEVVTFFTTFKRKSLFIQVDIVDYVQNIYGRRRKLFQDFVFKQFHVTFWSQFAAKPAKEKNIKYI